MIDGNTLKRNPIFRKRKVRISLFTGIMKPNTGTITLRTKSVSSHKTQITYEDVPTPKTPVTEDSTGAFANLVPKIKKTVTIDNETQTLFADYKAVEYEGMDFYLAEVTSFKAQSSAQTGTYTGALATVIQPWYFQPVTVNIEGISYMGAFDNENYNIGSDDDVTKLISLRNMINEDFNRSSIASQLKVKISISDDKQVPGQKNQSFVGIIDDISIDESDDNPYMQRYSIKFLGEYEYMYSMQEGLKGLRKDDAARASITTSGTIESSPKTFPYTQIDREKVNVPSSGITKTGLGLAGGIPNSSPRGDSLLGQGNAFFP